MNIKHAKQRGEWAEMRFMARAAEHGLQVSKPWGESTSYVSDPGSSLVLTTVERPPFRTRREKGGPPTFLNVDFTGPILHPSHCGFWNVPSKLCVVL